MYYMSIAATLFVTFGLGLLTGRAVARERHPIHDGRREETQDQRDGPVLAWIFIVAGAIIAFVGMFL